MLKNKDIICISSVYWDDPWLSNHQFMSRLAKSNRVLYVERPVTPLSPLVSGQKQHFMIQVQRWLSGGIRQVNDNLFIGAPPIALPKRFETPVLAINQFVRGMWIQRVAKKLQFSNSILWIYDPDAAPLLSYIDHAYSIYAITDDHPTRHGLNREAAIRKWENKLLAGVDLVITTAFNLVDPKKALNPNTHYVPHGVMADHFAQAQEPDYPSAPEMAQFTYPIIGFVGQVDHRIDIELIRQISDQHPDWSIVFIGSIFPGRVDTQALESLSNVTLLGRKQLAELPSFIKPMDVCIIPYYVDDHTRYMHPLKALEYLAAGKPVVSTGLPALADYNDYIVRAKTHDGFIHAIENALKTDEDHKRSKRVNFAMQNRWENRLEMIANLMKSEYSEISVGG